MNTVRKRRLIIVGMVLAATIVAVGIAIFALQRNVTYLFTPTEVAAGQAPAGSRFRLGGIVKEGSVKRFPGSMKVDFVVTDRFHSMPVQYSGVLPDLFRQGQSIITTGQMQGHTFVASKVLAKHDETYMPPQVAKAIKKAERAGRAHAEARLESQSRVPAAGAREPGAGARQLPTAGMATRDGAKSND